MSSQPAHSFCFLSPIHWQGLNHQRTYSRFANFLQSSPLPPMQSQSVTFLDYSPSFCTLQCTQQPTRLFENSNWIVSTGQSLQSFPSPQKSKPNSFTLVFRTLQKLAPPILQPHVIPPSGGVHSHPSGTHQVHFHLRDFVQALFLHGILCLRSSSGKSSSSFRSHPKCQLLREAFFVHSL